MASSPVDEPGGDHDNGDSRLPCLASMRLFSPRNHIIRYPPMNYLEQQDPEVWAAIAGEIQRQRDGLEMIASENYTSPAVMQAMGSVLTNKYAEGYPGRRYYGGCEFVDVAETSPATGPSSSSAPSTSTSSPIPGPRPTRPCTWRPWSRATWCSGWTWPTAAT